MWSGDDRSAPAKRCFVAVCGSSVVLCEFSVGDRFEELTEGPAHERDVLNLALRCLAGRQRLDVQVLRHAYGQDATGERHPALFIFLPDAQLPLATKTRDLDPDLVPDPRAATCFCCGPILQRIMYGEKAESAYRAYGCDLGRDPNGWYLSMTEHFYDAADDLVTFFGRLTKLRRTVPFQLVQLGDLFEVWAGYHCCFQSSGRNALVMPQVLCGLSIDELMAYWRDSAVESPIKRALDVVARFPSMQLEVPHTLVAELSTACPGDEQPLGVFALLAQDAMLTPWRRARHPDGPARTAIERWSQAPFQVYVAAHSHAACLTTIHVNPRRSHAQARRPRCSAQV